MVSLKLSEIALLLISFVVLSHMEQIHLVDSFLIWGSPRCPPHQVRLGLLSSSKLRMAPRYGPQSEPMENFEGSEEFDKEKSEREQKEWEEQDARRHARLKKDFLKLIDLVMETQKPDHLPGLMTKHLDLLLELRGYEAVPIIKEVIDKAENDGGEEEAQRVMEALEFILSFAEEFVQQAESIDNVNKKLLGSIINTMTNNRHKPAHEQESLLDSLMEEQKENFTPGFLRHLDGECARIMSAPAMTPESSRLMETLRVVHARVLEELGKDLGEGAIVLGQLLGYEDKQEMVAVLEGGLTVRGVGFAHELNGLTAEAINGFETVPGGADPDLVERVKVIDQEIRGFIDRQSIMQ